MLYVSKERNATLFQEKNRGGAMTYLSMSDVKNAGL